MGQANPPSLDHTLIEINSQYGTKIAVQMLRAALFSDAFDDDRPLAPQLQWILLRSAQRLTDSAARSAVPAAQPESPEQSDGSALYQG